MTVFKLAMHPASEGDALILTWGAAEAPRHALIDLGRTKNYRALKPLLTRIGEFELFTVTHIDADHIEGAVPLFKEKEQPFAVKHVWFNAFHQLEKAYERLPQEDHVVLGAAQAEKVTKGIVRSRWPWNTHFKSGIVSIDSREAKAPIKFDDGLKLTLLSPSDRQLANLIPRWNEELEKAGLRTTDPDEVEQALAEGRVQLGALNVEELATASFKEDNTEPNGTSIAFLAAFNGKRVLFGADAHPSVLERSLRGLGASESSRIKLDCFKMPHHGSKANTSPSLLKIIDCTRFAFSTDGSRHNHPNPETIARILVADPHRHKRFIFNFRQDNTVAWDNKSLMKRWNYTCVFPDDGTEGIEFDI